METSQEIVKKQIAGGSYQVGWRCATCGGWVGEGSCKSYYLSHKELEKQGVKIAYLREAQIYSGPICVICGEPGQGHHWAPQCIAPQFEEHGKWPIAFLCEKHHTEWHRIVTPDYKLLMRNNPESQQPLLNGDMNDK